MLAVDVNVVIIIININSVIIVIVATVGAEDGVFDAALEGELNAEVAAGV